MQKKSFYWMMAAILICGGEVRDNDRYCSHCGEKL